ncbi:MAG TPA: hypothetical protein VKH35_09210 [Thermoanaerobaculia bacterium]|nr:hypothetical protein [Thermoanaerobaculia bacterium]
MARPLAFALLLLAAGTALAAAPRAYHLELEANPAAPFPFLQRFGAVTLHVYPSGFRAETLWLDGFSRNGTSTVTVENPIGRIYADVPITGFGSMLRSMAGAEADTTGVTPVLEPPVSGRVGGIAARRYRLRYGPEAWIDIWTTTIVPEATQLRAIVQEVVRGISPGTATVLRSVAGTPLYVELNFSHYHRLPLVTLKRFTLNNDGESQALQVGRFYFRAPFVDAVLK